MSSSTHLTMLFLAVAIALISINDAACSWYVGGYGTVNLAPLQAHSPITTTRFGQESFSLYYTPCDNGYHCEGGSGSGNGMAAQVYSDDTTNCNGLISQFDSTKPTYGTSGNGEPQIVFDYPVLENIYSAGCSQGRQGQFIFICDHNADPYSDIEFFQDSGSDPCYYHTTMRTKYACATGGGGGGGDGATTDESGMSGGWVFIIILICLVSVYCIGGYVMAGVKSGNWGDVKGNIPQYRTLWMYVPKLVLAGCITSFEWIKGKAGGNKYGDTDDIYEQY